METHVYKTADHCQIHLDLYTPEQPGAPSPPAILFIHGGALINGTRDARPGTFERYLSRGFVVASIDYRLAPETKLPQIVSDVEFFGNKTLKRLGFLSLINRYEFSNELGNVSLYLFPNLRYFLFRLFLKLHFFLD